MKQVRLIFVLSVMAGIVMYGCGKEEIPLIESTENDGYITFYSKSTGDGCGPISLSLNGNSIGTLADTTATDPDCQAANGPGIITVGVEVGAHDYAAADDCNNIWTGTIIINKGVCKTKEISR